MEVARIAGHNSRTREFRIGISRDAATIPRLVNTLRQISSQLIVEDTPLTDCDIHIVTTREALRASSSTSGIRIVVMDTDESSVRTSMKNGAGAAISPDISVEAAQAVMSAVISGYYPVPRHLAAAIATRLEDPGSHILSDRDKTILTHLATGKTMAELARELGYSERHVRRQVRSLWNAMGVSGRVQGLIAVARRGFLEDDSYENDPYDPRDTLRRAENA